MAHPSIPETTGKKYLIAPDGTLMPHKDTYGHGNVVNWLTLKMDYHT
jgi:hypothetical protein